MWPTRNIVTGGEVTRWCSAAPQMEHHRRWGNSNGGAVGQPWMMMRIN
ncbi:hypothetical protein L195_g057098 [Trifolium pratense]|uniref:Uncharacterized protein n=1 Tax=Trifolium pratense TaxID=57577 RepID=A0A2K3KUZ1_TRIPR|nr:hypothetical protein L195_g057098 [Trifolium pratense]